MRFFINLKPTIITGHGIIQNPIDKVYNYVGGGHMCYSTSFGYGMVDRDAKYVYAFNIENFKRGKHRKNKHFTIYLYRFPIDMFKLFNIEIKQMRNRFKIVNKK